MKIMINDKHVASSYKGDDTGLYIPVAYHDHLNENSIEFFTKIKACGYEEMWVSGENIPKYINSLKKV